MKEIRFNASELIPSLTILNSIIPQKNTMSILSNIKVETFSKNGQSRLILTAGDISSCLQCVVKVETVPEEKTIFGLEGKKFFSALKNLDKKDVFLRLNEERHEATFLYENGEFSLPLIDMKDYPNMSVATEDMHEKHIPTEKMIAAIDRASFAIANDVLIQALNGLRMEFYADGLAYVSMTRKEMVMYKDLTVTHNGTDPNLAAFTLPKKPCSVLANVIRKAGGESVRVRFNDNNVMFDDGVSFKLTAKLLEDKFPDYKRFIPANTDKEAVVAVEPLMEALKRVMPMGDASSGLVKASFTKEKVTVSVEDLGFSTKASETVPCTYTGEDLEIGFDIVSMLNILSNIDDEYTVIKMAQKKRPAVFKDGTENELFEYTSALAPMVYD